MKYFFNGVDFAYVAEITTTLFFLFFVFVLLWSVRPSASKAYKEASMLPLEEEKIEDSHVIKSEVVR